MPTARPRDAATLILVRHDGDAPRLLMGRRSGGHDFMPDKWVFPGGRIDRADYRAPLASDLAAETAAALEESPRLARQDGARLARALAAAAVRETFEEAGLLLAKPHPGLTVGGEHSGAGAWAPFLERGVAPDLAPLSYIARAITPPARHRRFDARFLMADARHLTSLEPTDSRELAEIDWFTLEEACALDLPTVTRAVVALVDAHLSGAAPPTRPFWRWTRANPLSAL
jgi:8-oxo-dGTP pyrophosphatase MutT (NUDIX family)